MHVITLFDAHPATLGRGNAYLDADESLLDRVLLVQEAWWLHPFKPLSAEPVSGLCLFFVDLCYLFLYLLFPQAFDNLIESLWLSRSHLFRLGKLIDAWLKCTFFQLLLDLVIGCLLCDLLLLLQLLYWVNHGDPELVGRLLVLLLCVA